MNEPYDPRELDVRRRRAVAVGALAVAFLLLIIAVVLATTGGGGGGGGHAKRASQTTHRAPAKQRAAAPAPAPAATGQKNPTAAVPVLMYHLINSPKTGTAQPELWVPRADFQAQQVAIELLCHLEVVAQYRKVVHALNAHAAFLLCNGNPSEARRSPAAPGLISL